MNGRAWLIALVVLVVLGPVAPAAAQEADPPSKPGVSAPKVPTGRATSYDLAALILPPTEFDEPEFGIDVGNYSAIDDDAAYINDRNGGSNADQSDVRDELQSAGWQQSYFTHTGILDPKDDSLFSLFVNMSITRYKDADGAATGYNLLTKATINYGYQRVRNTDQVGDASSLAKQATTLNDGTPLNALDLTMQAGEFAVEITIKDYTGDKPNQAKLLQLGQDQVDMLADAKPGVGLSQRALRLTGDGLVNKYAYYSRLNDVQFAYVGETAKELRSDEDYYKGMGITDLYIERQTAPSTSGDRNDYFQMIIDVFQFDSADSAQSGYGAYVNGFIGNPPSGYSRVKKAARAGNYGDDSTTHSYTYARSDGTTATGYRTVVLLDDMMVLIYTDSGGDVPLDAVGEITDAAVTCAGKQAVCKSMPLPDALAA